MAHKRGLKPKIFRDNRSEILPETADLLGANWGLVRAGCLACRRSVSLPVWFFCPVCGCLFLPPFWPCLVGPSSSDARVFFFVVDGDCACYRSGSPASLHLGQRTPHGLWQIGLPVRHLPQRVWQLGLHPHCEFELALAIRQGDG